MSILIDRSTRVLVQGITGRDGSFHARSMKAYGTQVVGGVTPGKGGQFVDDMPVFNSVAEGRAATGATATCIFVPAPYAAKAILEAADAGIEFIVAITEGVPVLDMSKVWKALQDKPRTRLLGANCPGLITPGQAKIGIMPGNITAPGPIGLVSRSGTLTYEVVWALTEAGLGQTTCVGIGGDPINGTNFLDILRMFEADPKTEAVVMIGEIGGNDEEVAAEFIRTKMTKPVVGFIAGQTAPPGRRMGHAGAIVTGNSGTAESKIEAFRRAGVPVARITSEIPGLIRQVMAKRGPKPAAPKTARPAATSAARKSEDGAKRKGTASSGKTTPRTSAKAASAKTKATANRAKTAPSGKTAPAAASSTKTTQKSATSAKRAHSSARPAAHGKSQPGRPAGRSAVKTATASSGSRTASERSGAVRRASSSQAETRTETTRTKTQNASRTTVGGRMAKTAAPKKAAKKAARKSTAKKAAKKATKKRVAKKAPAKKATKKATKKRVAKKAPAKKAAKKTARKAARKGARKTAKKAAKK